MVVRRNNDMLVAFLVLLFVIWGIVNGFSQTLDSLNYKIKIIKSFPSPGPSPQGLAWCGNFLWVGVDSTDTI